ncbi:MAG: HdeA/HdeB family chaperone [Methyloceanibacter sp.]
MQRSKLLIAAIAIGLGAGSAVQAQVTIDVAKMTCAQFAAYKVASPKNIGIWLNGYYHGKRGDTVVDTQQLDEDTKKIQQYCIDNPNTPVMQAVETVVGPRN